MIGAIFWNYLSVVFSWIAETIAVERWEGTLEYTMMAPVRRWTQLLGSSRYAIVYGLVHTAAILVVLILFFPQLDLSKANPATAAAFMAPRLVQLRRDRDDGRHPAAPVRRARRADDVRRSSRACCSSAASTTRSTILPQWMQVLSHLSPATYVLDGVRKGLIDGAPLTALLVGHLAAHRHGRRVHPVRASGRSAAPSATPSGPASSRGWADAMTTTRLQPDEILVAEAPALAGLRFRHYRGRVDHPAMADINTAARRPTAVSRRSAPRQLDADYPHLPNCDLSRDFVGAELDGRLVGYGRVYWTDRNDGSRAFESICIIDPRVRGLGIGTAILAWQTRRSAELRASLRDDRPAVWTAYAYGTDSGARVLLETAGYAIVRRFCELNRDDFFGIPDLPLPDGFAVRPIDRTDGALLRRSGTPAPRRSPSTGARRRPTATTSSSRRSSPRRPSSLSSGRSPSPGTRSPVTSSTTSIHPTTTERVRAGPSRSPCASRTADAAWPARSSRGAWPPFAMPERRALRSAWTPGTSTTRSTSTRASGSRVVAEQFEFHRPMEPAEASR